VLKANGPPTAAEVEIRSRIAERGRLTFREFMEIALYHPAGGYYTDPTLRTGAGDYYTSPMAHPAFGAALAVQLRKMWTRLDRPARFTVVEMGAGRGGLATDLTAYAARLDSAFADALDYQPLDLGQAVPTDVTGCFLSNELLDAMPVARFEMVDGEAREVFVALGDEGAALYGGTALTRVLGEPVTGAIANRLAQLPGPLPDGSRGEVNPGVGPWMETVNESLHRGFVISIDYGGTAEEIYARRAGTLQTYFNHVAGLSPYQNVGRQDITAHVDFSLVEAEGVRVGLRSLGLTSQAELLRRNGIDLMADRLQALGLPAAELRANRYGIEKLTRLDGLGGFRVLVQEKGVQVKDTEVADLDGICPSSQELGELPATALLRDDHLRLAEGGYPSLSFELDSLWPESFDEPEPPPEPPRASGLPDSGESPE
jgi:SAM-dependent MidA family methyltransferase